MSELQEMKGFCSDAIYGDFETSKIEIKSFLDVDRPSHKSRFVRNIVALANTPRDAVIPYGLLVIGARKGRILDNLQEWMKDDNVYQNLIRKYCEPMIKFSFYKLKIDSKELGVFQIQNSDRRPHMIRENLVHDGKVLLARGQIYVREGSKTIVAVSRELHRYIIADFGQRIRWSLDELQDKEVEIFNEQFISEKDKVPTDTIGRIQKRLWNNIIELRGILRGRA